MKEVQITRDGKFNKGDFVKIIDMNHYFPILQTQRQTESFLFNAFKITPEDNWKIPEIQTSAMIFAILRRQIMDFVGLPLDTILVFLTDENLETCLALFDPRGIEVIKNLPTKEDGYYITSDGFKTNPKNWKPGKWLI